MSTPTLNTHAPHAWPYRAWQALTTPPQWALGQRAAAPHPEPRWMGTRITAHKALTAHCVELRLRRPKGWKGHVAGQHVRLSLYANGRREERYYSLTNAPRDPNAELSIAVQQVDHGRLSSHLVHTAQVGDAVDISGPLGEFHLPKVISDQPLLMLSAGSGITPIISMLRELKAHSPGVSVHHLHYARSVEDLIYAELLQELQRGWPNYRLDLSFTRAPSQRGDNARWSPNQQARSCSDWSDRQAWACGPDGWLDQLEQYWTQQGIRSQLHTERFFQPLRSPDSDDGRLQPVRFARSAATADIASGVTLLDAAEQQGLNPQYGCRMGICHSCDCELISGQVRDLRNGKVLAQPGQRIQPCVCTAISPIEIDL